MTDIELRHSGISETEKYVFLRRVYHLSLYQYSSKVTGERTPYMKYAGTTESTRCPGRQHTYVSMFVLTIFCKFFTARFARSYPPTMKHACNY